MARGARQDLRSRGGSQNVTQNAFGRSGHNRFHIPPAPPAPPPPPPPAPAPAPVYTPPPPPSRPAPSQPSAPTPPTVATVSTVNEVREKAKASSGYQDTMLSSAAAPASSKPKRTRARSKSLETKLRKAKPTEGKTVKRTLLGSGSA